MKCYNHDITACLETVLEADSYCSGCQHLVYNSKRPMNIKDIQKRCLELSQTAPTYVTPPTLFQSPHNKQLRLVQDTLL